MCHITFMTLDQWLTNSDVTSRRFTKIVGASYSAVSKWRQKLRIPRRKMLKKIEKKTNGKVKIQDWFL